MMENTNVEPWLSRMKAEVGHTCRTNPATKKENPVEIKI